jgi:transglutaminase-like putative cysteine protease
MVTINQLREAGTEYPEWVTDHYLQIPEEVTPRTRELARQITAGLDNPYDITQAVTEWLRDNIEYTEIIDPPPNNREPLDWFLFDYRKGFCNYYASAEIIMLRSLGIPARWTIGYAQGQSRILPSTAGDPGSRNALIYTVRERDAHAWPEVFFPNIGWVEFEPTVSQLPLLRPLGSDPLDQAEEEDDKQLFRETPQPDDFEPLVQDPPAPDAKQGVSTGVVLSGMIALAAIFIGVFAIIARRNPASTLSFWVRIIGGDEKLLLQWQQEHTSLRERFQQSLALMGRQVESSLNKIGLQPPEALTRWTQIALLPAVQKAYMEINWALQRIGKPPEVNATPGERANLVKEYIPEANKSTTELVEEYQKASYSLHSGDPRIARNAASDLRKLSFQARLKKLLSKFQAPP